MDTNTLKKVFKRLGVILISFLVIFMSFASGIAFAMVTVYRLLGTDSETFEDLEEGDF